MTMYCLMDCSVVLSHLKGVHCLLESIALANFRGMAESLLPGGVQATTMSTLAWQRMWRRWYT